MVQDITERKLSEERVAHVTAVLRSIRNVNQLITHEKDRERLIQKGCDLLVEGRSYEKSWILLLDENRNPVSVVSAGFSRESSAFLEHLKTGNYTECVTELMPQEKPFLAYDRPGIRHKNCVLADIHSTCGVFRCRLENDGKLFGVLGVSVSSGAVFDEEEQDLFLELCGDIAFALANIANEERQRQVEKRYQTTVQTSLDGFLIADTKGRLLEVNGAYCRLLGYSREELLAMSLEDVEAAETHEETARHIQRVLEAGSGRFETKCRCRDGKILDLDISVNYISAEGLLFCFLRDITERKKMQEQLMVTDRLASIGQLASGIAHEMNNPLTSVIGFSEMLMKRTDLPDDAKEDLKIVNHEAQRTARVVKGLLFFARKQKLEKEPVDMNSIIQGVLQLRSYEHRVSNIEVNTRLAPELPEVFGNSGQLQQVFINLIVNAEQAMLEAHNKRTLTIVTERVGDTVKASVVDDGPGISRENIGRLFTPFFTTKEAGKGTGLGLSICHGVVTEHGGKIYAESEPGKGATFVVELPTKK